MNQPAVSWLSNPLSLVNNSMKSIRIQMAFYDIDLEKKIESNHELRKINECIDFSSVAYRVNSGKSEVGRHGYGLDCGVFVFAIYV
jgi:hypothetical protein